MKLDPVRLKRQEGLLDSWALADYCGTAECATGFGKTITAILGIKRLQEEKPDFKTLVIVPTKHLQGQWREKLDDFDVDNVEVEIINSAVKGFYMVDLLILDEIHMYLAEVFSTVFEAVIYKKVLGLTAKVDEEDPRSDIIAERAPIFERVTMKEALENEWIAAFQIYNLGVDLEGEEADEYQKLTNKFKRYFAVFDHDFGLAMKCIKDKSAIKRHAAKLKWDEGRVRGSAYQFLNTMKERKKLLYTSGLKHQTALQLIDKFNDRNIITFSQTIESAEFIADHLNGAAHTYHSQVKGKTIDGEKLSKKDMLQRSIDEFSDEENDVHVLCTARAMDQGADLPLIDMVIVVSSTSKARQAIQRYGRSLRKHGDRQVIIVEIYARNTQDVRWLRSRQKKIPKSTIRWVTSIDEIS